MIVKADDHTIARAAAMLKAGHLVAFPTETVYGLGACALDPSAVAKIFEAKERPFFDPLIVHIAHIEQLSLIALNIPEKAHRLTRAFWPGPLTLVLTKSTIIPDIVTAGLKTVAVRMPAHPVARKLLADAAIPVAAPSANRFGMLSPTRAEHVDAQLGNRVDLILDGGHCSIGVESTIIKIDGEHASILRFGGTPVEEIQQLIGNVDYATAKEVEAPGQLPSHYAPNTPLVIISQKIPSRDDAAYLALRDAPDGHFRAVEILTPSGDLREAAANLFVCLHRLDSSGASVIFAEEVPEIGLGRAIMDRLRKAAKKNSC